MSEAKRVKGWAVKCKQLPTMDWEWAPSVYTGGRRRLQSRCEAMIAASDLRLARYAAVKLVRIVAKPKAPKPDKLEQAIAKLQNSLEYNQKRLEACRAAGEEPHLVRFWEGCAIEAMLSIKIAKECL